MSFGESVAQSVLVVALLVAAVVALALLVLLGAGLAGLRHREPGAGRDLLVSVAALVLGLAAVVALAAWWATS